MADSALDFRDRAAVFGALEAHTFDLLVIGAGITGTGIARDAAMRGLRVALIDANDVAAGTSSRSSKLVHGGLRYLAEGHVTVVREAASERKVLRRLAPHLALTMPMVIPAPNQIAMGKLRAAMWSYEKLGNVDERECHAVWDAETLRREEPHLRPDGLVGAVVYPEYVTDDGRLTLANARSAAGAGAVVATYAAATSLIVEQGKAAGAEVADTLDGTLGARVRARVVVNAAGPWVDAVRKLETPDAKRMLQLTKGIHVVLPLSRLPIKRTIIMQTPDKRSIFVVPRGAFVYFGTTDTFYPDADYWPEITREDVDYLLSVGGDTFDTGPFTVQDIVALWSGVRPLLGEPGKTPSEISRRDETMIGPAGVLSIAGGKLTSYRAMAERVVTEVEERLGRKPTASRTAEEPLPGGDFAESMDGLVHRLEKIGLAQVVAARAARLYGSEAFDVYAHGAGPGVEAEFAVLREGALTLEDYWVRRSARARFDFEGGLLSLEPAAKRMGELLGWSDGERKRQIDACHVLRDRELHAIR